MGLLRRKSRKQGDPPTDDTRNPVVRALLADAVLRLGSYALRRAVSNGVLRGEAGRKAEEIAGTKPSLEQRMVTAVATTVATRSVPGALLVGTGLLVRTVYRRGMARRARRLTGIDHDG